MPSLAALLAERLGALRVELFDSGTSALRLAMTDLAGASGGVIAVPAWGCYDILSAALGAGVPLAFYDIDPATLQPDLASLPTAPAAMVVVHAYGVPVDVAAVRAATPGTVIIEDAAQSWGGSLEGRPLGALGDLAVFSFGRGKGITGGRGGALAWLTREGAVSAVATRQSGWHDVQLAAVLWLLNRPVAYGVPASMPWLRLGETIFRPPRPPAALSRAAEAMIARSLPSADEEALLRRRQAERLLQTARSGARVSTVPVIAGSQPAWLRLPVVAHDEQDAATLKRDGRRLGIAGGYPRDLPSVARELGATIVGPVPSGGAQMLARRLVTVPVHGLLAEPDLAELERLLSGADRQ